MSIIVLTAETASALIHNVEAVLRQSRHLLQGQNVELLEDSYFACIGSGLPIDVEYSGCRELGWVPGTRISLESQNCIYVWGKGKGIIMKRPSGPNALSTEDLTPIRYFTLPKRNQ